MLPAIVVVAATMSDDLARDTPSAPPTHHRPWVGVVTPAAPFLERVAVLRGSQRRRGGAVRAMRVHALPVVLGGVDDQGERGSLDRS